MNTDLQYLAIPLSYSSVVVCGDDVFVEITPSGRSRLALFTNDTETVLVGLIGEIITISNVIHNDCAQMSHSLLSHCRQLFAILTELDGLYRSSEFPGLDTLASMNIPQLDSIVRCSGSEESAVWGNIHGPDGTLMSGVCS